MKRPEAKIKAEYKTTQVFPVVIPGRKAKVSEGEFLRNPTQFPTLKHLLENADEVYTFVDADQKGVKEITEDGVIVLDLKAGKPSGASRGRKSKAEIAAIKAAEEKDREITELKAQLAEMSKQAKAEKPAKAGAKAEPAKKDPAG